ncbi:hypothetical protein CW304_25885 [Bacillus sp. UFRGS-B20]|nr:hypothetical protein CW304_25885 [Bacillus sp. UFRGS-B20]
MIGCSFLIQQSISLNNREFLIAAERIRYINIEINWAFNANLNRIIIAQLILFTIPQLFFRSIFSFIGFGVHITSGKLGTMQRKMHSGHLLSARMVASYFSRNQCIALIMLRI